MTEREVYLRTKRVWGEKNRELWFSRWNVLRGVFWGAVCLIMMCGVLAGIGRF